MEIILNENSGEVMGLRGKIFIKPYINKVNGKQDPILKKNEDDRFFVHLSSVVRFINEIKYSDNIITPEELLNICNENM